MLLSETYLDAELVAAGALCLLSWLMGNLQAQYRLPLLLFYLNYYALGECFLARTSCSIFGILYSSFDLYPLLLYYAQRPSYVLEGFHQHSGSVKVVLRNLPLLHSLFLANLGKGYLELLASDLSLGR